MSGDPRITPFSPDPIIHLNNKISNMEIHTEKEYQSKVTFYYWPAFVPDLDKVLGSLLSFFPLGLPNLTPKQSPVPSQSKLSVVLTFFYRRIYSPEPEKTC